MIVNKKYKHLTPSDRETIDTMLRNHATFKWSYVNKWYKRK